MRRKCAGLYLLMVFEWIRLDFDPYIFFQYLVFSQIKGWMLKVKILGHTHSWYYNGSKLKFYIFQI